MGCELLPRPGTAGGRGLEVSLTRALTIVTVWYEVEGKPERAYTTDPERDKERLNMLVWSMPHRTALYRIRKKLSEEYMEKLNGKRGLSQLGCGCCWNALVKARLRVVFSQPKW